MRTKRRREERIDASRSRLQRTVEPEQEYCPACRAVYARGSDCDCSQPRTTIPRRLRPAA